MNMKRVLSAVICGVLSAALLTGCQKAADKKVYIKESFGGVIPENESASGVAAESIGADALLEQMAFTLEGVRFQLNRLPYSDIKNQGWSFDPELYGLQNMSAELGVVYDRGIYLNKDGYDQDTICIGMTNYNEEPCGIEDIQIWSIEFRAKDKASVPDVLLDGGITWGSDMNAVETAYGTPTTTERHNETGSTTVIYENDIERKVTLEVYDDGGVKNIILNAYN